MELDLRTRNLIAVGAAAAANCLPCLEFTLGRAAEDGAAPWELAAAVDTAKAVRAGAAGKLDALAESLLADYAGLAEPRPAAAGGCSCQQR